MMITITLPPALVDELAAAFFGKFKMLAATESKAPVNTGQLLTVADVAKRAKRCEKTILKWITSGRLHAVNQGTEVRPSYRIPESAWLAANTKR